RSIMPKMSGGAQNQLMSALKFLNLIGPGGEATERLRSLVKAIGTATWKEAIADMVSFAYSSVVGGLDIDTASSKQLNDRFRERGNVDGQMLAKSVRFYIKALREAGLNFSPHFKVRQAGAGRRASNSSRPAKQKAAAES